MPVEFFPGPGLLAVLGGPVWASLVESGWVGLVLLGVSMVGISHAIERAVRLRRGAVVPLELAGRVHAALQARDEAAARRCVADDPSTLARILNTLLDFRLASAESARTLADELGSADLKLHHQRAYPLVVCGTLAPLLGLLGTVVGLIGAFRKIAMAGEMGDPSLFAQDIGLALSTTALGLAVSIPLLALFHFFKARTHRLGIELEVQTTAIIREWFVRREVDAEREPQPERAFELKSEPQSESDAQADPQRGGGGDV